MKKEILNEAKIQFLSISVNEAFARSAAAAFASQCDPTVQEISEIKTAVSEAVTNAIVHGYRNTLGIVELTLRIYKNDVIYISVKDKGSGIEEEERSGLGFSVMDSFMDRLKVKSSVGKGTTVTMEKKLSRRVK